MLAIFQRRQVWVFLVVLLGLAAVRATFPAPAIAQANEEVKADAEPANEGVASEADKEKKAPERGMAKNAWWIIKTSGFIGLIILVLSIYFVSTVGRLFLELRPSVQMPPELVEDCEDMLPKREFKEIFAAVKEDQSPWGRIVATGIAELPNGLAEAREAAERVGEVIQVENERKISMLAVLGSMGPMIGLLGTLKGMIGSFSVIAQSDQQIKPSLVAENLSEALLLTFEGVALALPAIYFFAVFKNRVTHLGVTTLLSADEFIRRFAHAARTKSAPAATGPATTPVPPVAKK